MFAGFFRDNRRGSAGRTISGGREGVPLKKKTIIILALVIILALAGAALDGEELDL